MFAISDSPAINIAHPVRNMSDECCDPPTTYRFFCVFVLGRELFCCSLSLRAVIQVKVSAAPLARWR
jgi:hypothetical protein